MSRLLESPARFKFVFGIASALGQGYRPFSCKPVEPLSRFYNVSGLVNAPSRPPISRTVGHGSKHFMSEGGGVDAFIIGPKPRA